MAGGTVLAPPASRKEALLGDWVLVLVRVPTLEEPIVQRAKALAAAHGESFNQWCLEAFRTLVRLQTGEGLALQSAPPAAMRWARARGMEAGRWQAWLDHVFTTGCEDQVDVQALARWLARHPEEVWPLRWWCNAQPWGPRAWDWWARRRLLLGHRLFGQALRGPPNDLLDFFPGKPFRLLRGGTGFRRHRHHSFCPNLPDWTEKALAA